MNSEIQQLKKQPIKIMGMAGVIIVLALSYLLQDIDFLSFFYRSFHPYVHFISRKLVRVIINDTCLLLLIHLWFNDQAITRLAWRVQLVDTLVLLPAYLIVKLMWEGDSEISSPLLSQLHRMIVNPTLMILIIPGVYFHRLKEK